MTSTSLSLFDLKPGHVLVNRYQIIRPHRESGIGATFAVEDEESGDRLELQAFPSGLFESPQQAGEFGERLKAWKTLSEECLARLHDVHVLDDGAVLFVTDFPRGQSLRSWLEENPRMGNREVISFAADLLGGLERAHSQGLVHGDIKPASIFFDSGSGRGCLVDSGITPAMWSAKHLGTRTALIGTPFYAPIEQFTGDSPDELSDLYNLATVMYELLTGVLPWSGKGYIEVFQSKMQKVPPKMSVRAPGVEVIAALEEVVARGLYADRTERHSSAASFLEQLSAVSTGA